jgi:hypothetical protein
MNGQSAYSRHKIQLQRTKIYANSVKGLGKMLNLFFPDRKTLVQLVYSDQAWGEFMRSNKVREYPFFTYKPNTTGTDFEHAPPRNMFREGFYGGYTQDKRGQYFYKLIPVKISFIIRFICNDIDTLIEFQEEWMKHSQRAGLKFDLISNEGELRIPVDVEMSDELTTPDFSNEDGIPDIGALAISESEITLRTFIGEYEIHPVAYIVDAQTFAVTQTEINLTTDLLSAVLEKEKKLMQSNPDRIYSVAELVSEIKAEVNTGSF